MVLGLRGKNRRSSAIQVDYLVHIQEIKPWPPSQSLRSLRSVLIQWENGDRCSGSTSSVVPSLGSFVGEGKIEFNESFRLPLTLLRDMSVKGGDGDTFQKNCLELNLYEPRRDKTVKGQLLATAIIDLADYGVLKETLSISTPMNCKRSFKNTNQPVLYITLQSVEKARSNSSSRETLSRAMSLDNADGESVSALMNEEYAEEAEIASFTDDDVSSHSSVTASSNGRLHRRNEELGDTMTQGTDGSNKKRSEASKLQLEKSNLVHQNSPLDNRKGSSSRSSSIDLSSDLGSPLNNHASVSHSPISSSAKMLKSVELDGVHSSSSSLVIENVEEDSDTRIRSNGHENLPEEINENIANGRSQTTNGSQQSGQEYRSTFLSAKVALTNQNSQAVEKLISNGDSEINGKNNGQTKESRSDFLDDAATSDDSYGSSVEDKERKEEEKINNEAHNLDEESYSKEDELNIVQDVTGKKSLGSDTSSSSRENLEMKENLLKNERLKHVKSVRVDSARKGLVSSNQHAEIRESSVQGDAQSGMGSLRLKDRKDAKVFPRDTRSAILESKMQQLEHRIKMLEGELREAAAVEASLYSVVAEHGSSTSKVHAPARRLSRLYLHACRESSQSRRANAAKIAVSGLVLVAKACGNDVPRLTFWWSNSVVLRTIISQAARSLGLPLSAGPSINRNSIQKVKGKVTSPLKWKVFSPVKREGAELLYNSLSDWEEPHTFTCALEKIESWIFSRIIESIWWQTLTPHMQSVSAKEIDKSNGSGPRKSYSRVSRSCDQEEQGNFSLDLWKKAFRDAFERLCPVRAGGHECGCLPMLARLVMEQCVARLDVAMFNAILRESGDEIPTDPVSDPISDSVVLPIPPGKSSFGAGAQLKNAIGNWSRWLTDLFGLDDDDSLDDVDDHEHDDERQDTSFKSFHLLNALSDLLMLPKDMLLSGSIRKEVCPTFGAPLIKRILDNFVPDEFCPDPIPDVVLEALESEDPTEAGEEAATNFPCTAAAIVYSPPSTASIASFIGEVGGQANLKRSGSSVVRKSYTSDDELDELNSPLALILNDGPRTSPVPTKSGWISKENNTQNALRYELLRDVWMEGE
ncbi:EEIG1/EHBP1 N-terminal domain containing protein [Parasponia andersonii]|uniref:EEIG1/EHBP1 N-terminal domain containing protein n=1 Tax=Parasponia andersonii TaxID=3476 RepID=A0A2P5CJY3_PARAD|nr:EEIG1/EHBP1 N-terminal domain containing protein [Parasponia andersonii]